MHHARVAAQGAGRIRRILEVQGVVSGAGGAISNGHRNVQVVQIALAGAFSSVVGGVRRTIRGIRRFDELDEREDSEEWEDPFDE